MNFTNFKTIFGTVLLIALLAAIMLAFDRYGIEGAEAHHNNPRYKQVARVWIPANSTKAVRTPGCTDSIVFTRRGRHITRGFRFELAYSSVAVTNYNRFGVYARTLCKR